MVHTGLYIRVHILNGIYLFLTILPRKVGKHINGQII